MGEKKETKSEPAKKVAVPAPPIAPAPAAPANNNSGNHKKVFCICLGCAFVFFAFIGLIIVIGIVRAIISGNNDSSSYTPSAETSTSSTAQTPAKTYPTPENCKPAADPAAPKPSVSTSNPGYFPALTNRYYEIYGWTITDLQNQMKQCGLPNPYTGTNSAVALTTSVAAYTYLTDVRAGGMVGMKDLAYGEQVVITYPRWNQPADAPATTASWWKKFISDLEVHENTHKQITYDVGQETYNRLLSINVDDNAGQTVDAAISQIFAEENDKMSYQYKKLDGQVQ